jgi:NadR type nicotinamide-nucleotide adenylyltransferase
MHTNPIKRIAIVGPECTGKSSIALSLASHYQTTWVPEFARDYLNRLGREYVQSDLIEIAKGQLLTEDEHAQNAKQVLICDTNLVVIKIWSEFKYGNCDPEILKLLNSRKYDLHLLTDIDIPWENDPLREHPNERQTLFNIYQSELEKMKVPFIKISGSEEQRNSMAIRAIDQLLNT